MVKWLNQWFDSCHHEYCGYTILNIDHQCAFGYIYLLLALCNVYLSPFWFTRCGSFHGRIRGLFSMYPNCSIGVSLTFRKQRMEEKYTLWYSLSSRLVGHCHEVSILNSSRNIQTPFLENSFQSLYVEAMFHLRRSPGSML